MNGSECRVGDGLRTPRDVEDGGGPGGTESMSSLVNWKLVSGEGRSS